MESGKLILVLSIFYYHFLFSINSFQLLDFVLRIYVYRSNPGIFSTSTPITSKITNAKAMNMSPAIAPSIL